MDEDEIKNEIINDVSSEILLSKNLLKKLNPKDHHWEVLYQIYISKLNACFTTQAERALFKINIGVDYSEELSRFKKWCLDNKSDGLALAVKTFGDQINLGISIIKLKFKYPFEIFKAISEIIHKDPKERNTFEKNLLMNTQTLLGKSNFPKTDLQLLEYSVEFQSKEGENPVLSGNDKKNLIAAMKEAISHLCDPNDESKYQKYTLLSNIISELNANNDLKYLTLFIQTASAHRSVDMKETFLFFTSKRSETESITLFKKNLLEKGISHELQSIINLTISISTQRQKI